MSEQLVPSDVAVLDLLRKQAMSVTELATALSVTQTAVRQRLIRLMGQGFVDRTPVKAARGRPSHRYELTRKGRRKTGSNFADLAAALWQEIREIEDPEVRRGLLQRIAGRLAVMYSDRVEGQTLQEKMNSIAELFSDHGIPFSVDTNGSLPVLTALACPYPDLADQDRGVCAMEKSLFSELLGEDVQLSQCRLDGETCCTFEPRQAADA